MSILISQSEMRGDPFAVVVNRRSNRVGAATVDAVAKCNKTVARRGATAGVMRVEHDLGIAGSE
jgi:hypothetical protein